MKAFIFFARAGIFLIFFFSQPALRAQIDKSVSPGDIPNHVVIGAFAIQNNAVKFTRHAAELDYQAKFDIHPRSSLYFVYVLSTKNRKEAFQEVVRLRKETEFFDAWVYEGSLGKSERTQTRILDQENIPEGNIKEDSQLRNEGLLGSTEKNENKLKRDENLDYDNTNTNANVSSSLPLGNKNAESTLSADEIEGKNFYFQLFRPMDNQSIEGDVDIIESEKSRKLASYKGNTPVKVSIPLGKSGIVSFVCEVFGYRKVQKEFNFKEPVSEGFSIDSTGTIVIPFELVRLQKGDIAVMYNVFFFKDAAVMRPESRHEVTNLLEMLKENPKYRIKIHGHTNGNAHGKIITMSDTENFFSLSGTKDGFGSAKKLSYKRASVIRDYLVSNGIDENRMAIKAWGGKRSIYDRHSNRAQENVRVEVEILEH